MRKFTTFGLLLLLACGTAGAQTAGKVAPASTPPMAKVSELMTKALKDYPGKEAMMITVVYPPGSVDPVHRHHAHAFVYVLEGSIVMGLNGGKTVTLGPGQTFYEGPDDVHTVGRNASKTKPAKFLVFLLKDRDAPVLIPVH
ncbi:cupin domain-containing protein [Rhodanobacter sp. FDAARGOS 1247]|uniref:cupin domain-containing protein n=1 Tax=Rhodanobacter sp. FDAARGOS 1247 TaxID=2778082 RepID=UPI0019522F66|nr:cupin domain-containing protein [Rhodanobacter sp. FDAARGOS 1247]QRP65070.1 cupin domain-containing protein [Rhodanobacter sp. FDAARGOS 1247]